MKKKKKDILKKAEYLHKEMPKTKNENDFWGQVGKTVNGEAVSQDQIDMIVHTIKTNLSLQKNDILMDIGCGNGALSHYFFDKIKGFEGVDYSEYLIKIAKKYFENKSGFLFTKMNAVDFIKGFKNKKRITKVLCYGTLQYFSEKETRLILNELNNSYPSVKKIFIGALPDKANSNLFFKDKKYTCALDDYETPLGIWRTTDEFKRLAKETGWNAIILKMPTKFYATYYRYDVLLTR